jgi:hypothetical protein
MPIALSRWVCLARSSTGDAMEVIIYCEKKTEAPWGKRKLVAGHLTAESVEAAKLEFTTSDEFKKWRFLACEPRSDFEAARAQNRHLRDDDFIIMRYRQLFNDSQATTALRKAKPAPALPVEVWNENKVDAEHAWNVTKTLCSGGHF